MKKAGIFVVAPALLAASMASGAVDLTGTWCVDLTSNYSQGLSSTPVLDQEEVYEIVIDAQGATGFYGHVDVGTEFTYFSGIIDGKDVYFTHWDSITTGRLGKNGTEISFVNQAFDADDRSAKTSIGLASKGACP